MIYLSLLCTSVPIQEAVNLWINNIKLSLKANSNYEKNLNWNC